MSEQTESNQRTRVGTTVGFILWRGGLLFCAGYLAYEGVARAARLVLRLGIPVQLALGVAFFVFGFILLLASLIVERVEDSRAERGLKDL